MIIPKKPIDTRSTAERITPEYRAARAARETKREVLATQRIQASHDKAVALGIVDQNGKRIKKDLPPDMQLDWDRSLGE
jgi:hypothetical protein